MNFSVASEKEMHEIFALRFEVFVLEQNVPQEIELDGEDQYALHFFAEENGTLIGCARVFMKEKEAHIGRFAIKKAYRGKGIGRKLCLYIADYCRKKGCTELWLNSQLHAVGFYQKCGFEQRGEIFTEAGIKHVKMVFVAPKIRIVNLIEDTQRTPLFFSEHGLSFYIETKNHKLLFDTGASDAFLKNAEMMGIDLRQVDTVIISHGHYDHTGGLLAFRKINPSADIYMQKSAVRPFYNLKYPRPKYIGMHPDVAVLEGIKWLSEDLVIDDQLSLFMGVSARTLWPKGNATLKIKQGEAFVQDVFDHEQYLVLTVGENKILFSGCAHNGILNILEHYRTLYGGAPTHVISGFHTSKKEYTPEDNAIILETAKALVHTDTVYYTGHCTGEYSFQMLKEIMLDRLIRLQSGDEIVLNR